MTEHNVTEQGQMFIRENTWPFLYAFWVDAESSDNEKMFGRSFGVRWGNEMRCLEKYF